MSMSRGFLAILVAVVIIVLGGLGQRRHHADSLLVSRAVDISWEVCRAAMGEPVYHKAGGGWIRTAGLGNIPSGATEAGDWVWADAAGKLAPWPRREDDGVDDADVCAEGWRAGLDVATEGGG